MAFSVKGTLLLASSASLLLGLGGTALAQTPASTGTGTTVLPGIEVVAPRRVQPPRRPRARATTRQRAAPPATPPKTEAQVVAGRNEKFDEALRSFRAPLGAVTYQLSQQAI